MTFSKIRCALGLAVSIFFLNSCGGGDSSSASSQPVTPPDTTPPDTTQPTDSDLAISSINVVDSSNLALLQQISDDMTLNIDVLPENFNFIAIPADDSAVESVEFVMEGCASIDRTENAAPYTLQAESLGIETLSEGSCYISAKSYSEDNESGEEGPELVVTFEVISTAVPGNSNPTIQLNGSANITISLGDTYNDQGATATDEEDGDLTSIIQVEGADINTLIAGTYLITYLVVDSAGALASTSRSVTVLEAQPPQITVIGNPVLYTAVNEAFSDPGATAFDQEDGDLTSTIQTSSNVDTSTIGSYQITYSVTDSSGETDEAVREVIVVDNGSSSGDVVAEIRSLTRLNGVSPETVYFSAEGSTCSDCNDLWGLNTTIADAYSELAYHFDFDDSDSGTFATTGNSRNSQVGGAPRAAHTFHCYGPDDPNWDSGDQRCEFDVGVRVQSQDNDYDDAFIRINIQPLVGTGGYYSDSDVTCVSSTSDYSDCLALAPGASTSTNVPSHGNWDGKLAIIDNNGGNYNDICMGADEQNGTAIAYGPNLVDGAAYGSRPRTGFVRLSSRDTSCNSSHDGDTYANLANNHPERNGAGELIDGFGFNQKVVGLKVGAVANGNTMTFVHFHDLDMDWSSNTSEDGEFTMANNPNACRSNGAISCNDVPYPSFLFLTDSILKGSSSNYPQPTNIGCFNACGFVNAVIMGTEVGTAEEHNLRMQGAWGLILSNNWFRGNHIGGKGGKSRVTVRTTDTQDGNNLSKNPETLSGTNYTRGNNSSAEFHNKFNVMVDNIINQSSQLGAHASASWTAVGGQYFIEDATEYIPDGVSDGQSALHAGMYRVSRNISWARSPNCGFSPGDNGDNTEYRRSSTIYFEGNPSCNTAQNFQYNTAPLAVPAPPSL